MATRCFQDCPFGLGVRRRPAPCGRCRDDVDARGCPAGQGQPSRATIQPAVAGDGSEGATWAPAFLPVATLLGYAVAAVRGVSLRPVAVADRRPVGPAGDPWLGIFGTRDGEEFACALVASPIIINSVVLCGPGSLRGTAIPLLVAAQALLVLADRRLLERSNTGGTPMPSPLWSLLPLGWLALRGRFQTPSRPFAGAWCPASLIFLLPFISMVSNPSCGLEGRGCRTGATVMTDAAVEQPAAGSFPGALPGPIESHGFRRSSVHGADGITAHTARDVDRSRRGPATPRISGAR